MFLASLALVPRSHGGDRLDGQGLQHLLVHISELLYVEAAFAGRVLAELCEQRLRVAEQLKPKLRMPAEQNHVLFNHGLLWFGHDRLT